MCIKALDHYANTLEFVPDRYKTKEMCDAAVSKNYFMLKYCHDKYNVMINIRLRKYVVKLLMIL